MHFKSIVAVIWNCHVFKIHIINNLNNITHCIFWSLLSFHDDEGDKFTSYSENTNNQKFYLDQVINFVREYKKGSMKMIAFTWFLPFLKNLWNYFCINQYLSPDFVSCPHVAILGGANHLDIILPLSMILLHLVISSIVQSIFIEPESDHCLPLSLTH